MKNVYRFLTWNHFRLTLVSVFLLGTLAQPATAQYRVGTCAGATHATLMDAYAAVQSVGLAVGTTIEICPGTYLNEPLLFTAITVGIPGARLTIKGMTSNPGDALFRITNPSPIYALKLDGARNIDFKNIMFDIEPHASRASWKAIWATNFADDITFSNVLLEVPGSVPGTGADRKYAVVHLNQFAGNFQFYDCIFNGGAIGIYANQSPLGATAELNVRRGHFDSQERKTVHVTSNFAGTKVDLRNNTIISSNAYTYVGLRCESVSAAFTAKNNAFVLSNKGSTTGIESTSPVAHVHNNLFHLTDCANLKGIYVHGQTDDAVIERNSIYEFFPTLSTIHNLSEGVVFEGDYKNGFQSTKFVEIKQNIVESENHYLGNGIRLSLNGGKIQHLLDISDNRIVYSDLRSNYNSACNGILVDGHQTEVGKTHILNNEIRFEPGLGGSSFSVNTGIVVQDLRRDDAFTVFNNLLELGKQGASGGRGIALRNIQNVAGGFPLSAIWVGNNMMSMEVNNTDIRGLAIENVNSTRVYHNSVHLRDENPNSSGTTVTAFQALESSPGSMTDLQAWNNIWSNNSGGLQMDISCASCLSQSNFNLFAPAGAFRVRGPGSTSVYTTRGSWTTATGLDASSKVGAPEFVSDTDLHIQALSTSKAWNQGAFLSYPPVDLTLQDDIDGDSRITGDVPDIGADENAGVFKSTRSTPGTLPTTWDIFPNPSTGTVWLRAETASQVSILDLQGRLLQQHEAGAGTSELNLSSLPAGTYLFRRQAPNQPLQVRKLIRH